jgi:hypothetical protein
MASRNGVPGYWPCQGWWRVTGSPQAAEAMSIAWFDSSGLLSLARHHRALQLSETAVVRKYAGWCERGKPQGIPLLDCATEVVLGFSLGSLSGVGGPRRGVGTVTRRRIKIELGPHRLRLTVLGQGNERRAPCSVRHSWWAVGAVLKAKFREPGHP